MSFIRWEVNGGNRLQLFGDLKGAVHPKSKNSVIIYSASHCYTTCMIKKKKSTKSDVVMKTNGCQAPEITKKTYKTIINVVHLIFF